MVAASSVAIAGGASNAAPVADVDAKATAFGTATTVDVLKNDVSYGADLDPATVDLDPKAAGVQSTLTVPGGTLVANPDGTVTVTPAAGFTGSIAATYTVSDQNGKVSNAADLSVNVAPPA